MTILLQLQEEIQELITTHGEDHEVACFLVTQDMIQDWHMRLGRDLAGQDDGSGNPIPPPKELVREQLLVAVRHLETGVGWGKLMGVPMGEALNAAFHPEFD